MAPYLIDELTTVEIVGNKDLGPQLWLATFDKITGLLLKHRVVVGDGVSSQSTSRSPPTT